MTRKKWNRLRRQRPELFRGFTWRLGWESMIKQRPLLKTYGKKEAIAALTAFHLRREQ